MPQAILFDLDNTLIDYNKMKTRASAAAVKAMRKAGLKIGQKQAEKLLWELYREYGIEHQRIFQKFLKNAMGRIDYRIMVAGIVAYRAEKRGYMMPYPGTKGVLRKLKRKYKIGIVTNAPVIQAWLRLEELGLADMFDVVVTPLRIGMKPSPLPFRSAIRKLGIPPKEIVMVGDDLRRDVEPAKRLGMTTVWARYGAYKKRRQSLTI